MITGSEKHTQILFKSVLHKEPNRRNGNQLNYNSTAYRHLLGAHDCSIESLFYGLML